MQDGIFSQSGSWSQLPGIDDTGAIRRFNQQLSCRRGGPQLHTTSKDNEQAQLAFAVLNSSGGHKFAGRFASLRSYNESASYSMLRTI